MNTLVVFFALTAVACGSFVPLAQPPHHPALVLDPHGRPLDTAEVINARALHLQAKALEHHPIAHAAVVAPVAHAAIVAPAAVSHQSRVDVHHNSAVVAAPVIAAAPLISAHGAHSAYSTPYLGHSAFGLGLGHGHYLKKRSLGHYAYSAPIIAPAAVSHQSRVDVVSSPAIVSHAVAAPVLSHAVATPVLAHAIAPAAVSHQSRVDVVSSPSIVAHSAPVLAVAPYVNAHSAYATPYLAHSGLSLAGHGHYLKKRSLGHYAYSAPIIAPAAVSHQSRVDVVSSPAIVSHAVAAPVLSHAVATPVLAHAIAPAAVSHQSRVDVVSSPSIVAHSAPVLAVAPYVNAHSAYATPYLAHSGLSLAGHGHYLKKRSLGHYAYSAPIIAPAAVSHQSRVDVVSSPAIVSHAVAAPVLSHAVAPVYAHALAPAAVSHQSRVDVRTSPAVYAHVAPVAHSVIAAPLAHSGLLHAPLAHGAGHLVHGW